jgi:2-haloalkanoic acid dehalogenase type II
MKYKIISFDIFQTLVDVNKRIPDIWRGVLKEEYTEDKGIRGATAVLSALPEVFGNAIKSEKFKTMEEVYLECAEKAVKKLDFAASASNVSYHLMFQHSKAPFYPEVLNCIAKLKQKYEIILSSDSNHLMVDDLICRLEYKKAFISDDLKCYKGDPNGKFFRFVLQSLNISPDEILHIGDSSSDIEGAHKAGITSCFINRNNRKWNHLVQPDYVIRDFNELLDIL